MPRPSAQQGESPRTGTNNNDPRIAELYKQATDWEKKLAACVVSDDSLDLKIHVDHIVPLALGGEHVFENLNSSMRKGAKPQLACMTDA